MCKYPKIQLPFDREQSKEYNDFNPTKERGLIVKVFAMAMMMEMRMCNMGMRSRA